MSLLPRLAAAATALILALPAGASASDPRTGASDLRAGAVKVLITPNVADFPFKAAGERDFTSIHDDVYARALALRAGGQTYLLVNLEVTIVPDGEGTIRAVAAAAHLPASHVLVFSSHTHSNPLVFFHGHEPTPAQARAIDKVRQGAIAAATGAIAALAPAMIGHGRGTAHVNVNNGELVGLKTWFDADGPSSSNLDLLEVTTRDGKPLALLVNYATHGEVMFRSVSKDGGYEASGDLPGATMRLLETAGTAPVVLWSPAAEADQLPMFKSVQPAVGGLPARDEGGAGWALVDVQARRLAIEIGRALPQVGPMRGAVSIAADMGSVSCPAQVLKVDHDNGKATLGAAVAIPLNYLRIDDLVLAGVAGDVDSQIGAHIQAALPGRHAIVMTLMAGSIGYILPDRAYEKPGHGVSSSSLQKGCAEPALVAKFEEMNARSR